MGCRCFLRFHVLGIVNSTAISFEYMCLFNYGFLRLYASWWDFGSYGGHIIINNLLRNPYYSPQWLCQFIFPLTVQEGFLFSPPSPAFTVCRFFDDGLSDGPTVTTLL